MSKPALDLPDYRALSSQRQEPASSRNDRLLTALHDGQRWAKEAFFNEHAPDVLRVLRRVIGNDPEIADLLHEVFARAFHGINSVGQPRVLKSWITSIAVFTARECIRRRKRRRWLQLFETGEPPEMESRPGFDSAAREALVATYRLLDRLDVDERVAFCLRTIEGMELTEVASACGVSLATVKRRLARAQARFMVMAQEDPVVREWTRGGALCPTE